MIDAGGDGKLWLPPRPALIRPAPQSPLLAMPLLVGVRTYRAPPSRSNTDNANTVSNATTYTFSARALGTPVSTSLVVVVAHVHGGGINGEALSSISIDGTVGTLHQNARGFTLAGSSGICGIASRATSNTTGAVVVSCTQQMISARIAIYRLNGLFSATPNHSNKAESSSASSLNTTIDVLASGLIIAGFSSSWNTTPNISGITQDGHGSSSASAWGSDQSQSAATGRTITGTGGSAGNCGLAVVAWK